MVLAESGVTCGSLAALQRYHENPHIQLIAIRRTWRIADGSRQRVFLTVSCFRPQRPEAAEEVDLQVMQTLVSSPL